MIAASGSRSYRFGGAVLDPAQRRLTIRGAVAPITGRAFDLFVLLVENVGKLVSDPAAGGRRLKDALALARTSGDPVVVADARTWLGEFESIAGLPSPRQRDRRRFRARRGTGFALRREEALAELRAWLAA